MVTLADLKEALKALITPADVTSPVEMREALREELLPSRSPKVSISFDDGLASHYTIVKPLMDARFLKGISPVIPGSVGGAGYMTWAQIRALSADGWEISGHSGLDLTTLSDADLEIAVRGTKTDIEDQSISVETWVWSAVGVAGSPTQREINAVRRYYKAARHWYIDENYQALNDLYASYTLKANHVSDLNFNLANINTLLEKAKHMHAWVIFYVHGIPTELSVANLTILLDAIVASNIPCVTFREVAQATELGKKFVTGTALDKDGSGNIFKDDQPIATTTPTHYITLDPQCKKFMLNDVKYRFEAAAVETFQLYLLEDADATAILRRRDVIYNSGTGKTGSTDYHDTPDGRVPVLVKLVTAGRLYYLLDWSGAPGNTPGYIVVRGEIVGED